MARLLLIATSAAMFGLAGASCSSNGSGPQTCAGVVNCLCRPDGSCNSGLVCSAGVCVTTSGTGGSGTGGSGSGGSGSGGSVTGGSGASGSGATAGTLGTGGNATGGSAGGSTGGSLAIVSFTATTATLTGGSPSSTETDSATLTAIVTDSYGLDTIAGGQLLDDAGLTLAAFTAGANKSTFTAAVSWTGINLVSPITFLTSSGQRTFTAKFYDNQGNTATANLTLALMCRGLTILGNSALLPACAGTCTDTTGYANCGACGSACLSPGICQNAKCTTTAASTTKLCLYVASVDPMLTCNAFCATANLTCTDGGLSYALACSPISASLACSSKVGPAGSNSGAHSFECVCK